MKIIIAGCGKVGFTIAEQLNKEGHEITVIDINAAKLRNITDSVDIMGVEGNAAILNVQLEAGIQDADLMIATTDSDEMNMLCCLIAKKAGNNCHTIARIRNPEYTDEINYIREELNLSMSINPELTAAREIARLIKFPFAIKVDTFANGRVELLKFVVPKGSVLHGMKIMDTSVKLHCSVLIGAVERGKDVYIPDGSFELQEGDKISVVSESSDTLNFFRKVGIVTTNIRTAMFVGGGRVTYYLTKLLEGTGIKIKIVEKDLNRCNFLSEKLSNAMILFGDGSDQQLLLEEGLDTVDAFAALTGFDEENIMLSLYAGSLSDTKLITKINKVSFEDVIQNLNLGSVIHPKLITADHITRYVRAVQNSMGSNVESLVRIAGERAEALEFRVEKGLPMIGIPLQDLSLIDNLLIACINRGGKIITPRGKDTIEAGDTVIVVTTHLGLQDLKDILK